LSNLIKAQHGLEFDELSLVDQQRATVEMSKYLPLVQITNDINAGKMSVSELAFAVDGQASGVKHAKPVKLKQRNIFQRMWDVVADRFWPQAEITGMTLSSEESMSALTYTEHKSGGRSFVQRLGRTKIDTSLSYVKQLEQQPNTPLSQT